MKWDWGYQWCIQDKIMVQLILLQHYNGDMNGCIMGISMKYEWNMTGILSNLNTSGEALMLVLLCDMVTMEFYEWNINI